MSSSTTMSADGPRLPRHDVSPRFRRKKIPHNILGTALFVVTEIMFFTGLISAYLVLKAGSGGAWVPPGEITLPVLVTGFNTFILLMSGVHLYMASRNFSDFSKRDSTATLMMRAILLGLFFVGFQGYEWVQLIGFGMTMTSGVFAACFYLLIGAHGIHALSAILVMYWLYRKLQRQRLRQDHLISIEIYWYFVVGVWPLLYALVYF